MFCSCFLRVWLIDYTIQEFRKKNVVNPVRRCMVILQHVTHRLPPWRIEWFTHRRELLDSSNLVEHHDFIEMFFILDHIILYHCVSYYIILYHIISYYIMLYHITSHYIILNHIRNNTIIWMTSMMRIGFGESSSWLDSWISFPYDDRFLCQLAVNYSNSYRIQLNAGPMLDCVSWMLGMKSRKRN